MAIKFCSILRIWDICKGSGRGSGRAVGESVGGSVGGWVGVQVVRFNMGVHPTPLGYNAHPFMRRGICISLVMQRSTPPWCEKLCHGHPTRLKAQESAIGL